MYMYVDDVRTAPPYSDVIAKDYASAIRILKLLPIEILDLDYAMGPGGNGLQILEYMVANGIKVKKIKVHSDHSIGRPKMIEYINDHKDILLRKWDVLNEKTN